MKFYDRKEELIDLERIRKMAFSDHSKLTVMTGRRRIGKTSLIMRASEGTPTIYLFVSRMNEALLCQRFIEEISGSLDIFVPAEINRFASLFRFLMEAAQHQSFNLIIDEFQEFWQINSSVYSEMQDIWDRYRLKSHMNLIVSGSVYTLMSRIFENAQEPLFNRQDLMIRLKPFPIATLKEIMYDYYVAYTHDDLLALYSITGGVPKYIEQFCDFGALSKDAMIDLMVRENSNFVDEGKNILIEVFGKDYSTYFSILGSIAAGYNTQPQIEFRLGGISIGGHLKRLVTDYQVISRVRPILAKEGTHAVRYEIRDNFLHFWFRYFNRNRSIIEIGNYPALRELIRHDYPTWSGLMLERYFKQLLAETHQYRAIGSWWEPKGNQNEIDIVALKPEKNQADVFEVKRNPKNYKPDLLHTKAAHLQQKVLGNYEISAGFLSLDDM